ncbi:MAG: endolytic transglycosylase MltG [Spirochaetales bacterium]|jgi:UPF0755 protein|nr:endolytic transglycosylase MltG [Spirochaetales bacterium]
MVRFLFFLFFLAFFLVGAAWYLDSPSDAPGGESVPFTITRGEPLSSVARRLEERGLLRSAEFLVVMAKVRGTEKLFQAGAFLVPRGKRARELHDFFIQGSQLLRRVTIPEGYTLSRIAGLLEENGICGRGDFLAAAADREFLRSLNIPAKNIEGYLFPDTYFFPEEFPALRVAQELTDTFFRRVQEIYPAWRTLEPEALHGKVTLASIIEREYRVPSEAPLMASVFYNRLEVGMALGSCATVEYIITEVLGKPHPGVLTYRDLEIASPYNTYIHAGLPPGPISNPGETALSSVFFPEKTDYWYFVLKDPAEGTHFFSRSLREHNSAKVLYLKKVS